MLNKTSKTTRNGGLLTTLTLNNAFVTLDGNQTESLRLIREGTSLLREMVENGMDEERAGRVRDYVNRCNSAKSEMHNRRRPFTTALTLFQKKFVAEENAIDPAQTDSPAAEARRCILAWQQAQIDAAAETERRLLKNRETYERKLSARHDLSDEQREKALERADLRLLNGQKSLRTDCVQTEQMPVITSTDGYLEVFKYWWNEIGKGLPVSELERHFRPMLSYACKQARKGILITGNGITYKNVPKS